MKRLLIGAFGLILLLMFLTPVYADEEVCIEYLQGDIGDIHRFWHGQGELIATDLGKSFELNTNGNEIVSYATDADIVSINADSIKFISKYDNNQLHMLFMTQKPEGHGILTLKFSTPYISGEYKEQRVKIKIENAERILYLNGPVFIEKKGIYSEGKFKVIEVEKTQKDFKIIYVTKLAYTIFSTLVGTSIFTLFLLGVIFFRRKTINQKIRRNMKNISFSKKLPISLREHSDNVELKLDKLSISKYIGKKEEGVYFKIPKSFIAGLFTIMVLYIIFKSLASMISNYAVEIGAVSYLIIGLLILLGILIFILLLAVNTVADLTKTISILTGGIIMVIFSNIGLLIFPVAVVAALIVYGLSKIIFVNFEME
jgi:hypothetical protein